MSKIRVENSKNDIILREHVIIALLNDPITLWFYLLEAEKFGDYFSNNQELYVCQ